MTTATRGILVLALTALVAQPTAVLSGPTETFDREAELEMFRQYVDEAFPTVMEMTGIDEPAPVPAVMLTRAEVEQYVLETVGREYPDDELVKRGECLGALGLIPLGYDLEAGFLELITEEAGAFYDPHTDDLKGILDLHPMLKTPQMQKMIISHELAHALQDRVIDLATLSREALSDMDFEYCLRVVIEGMACNVMLAYMNDLPLEETPDVQAFMRAGFDMKYASSGGSAIIDSPLYVRESLLNPYAEGGGFVQTWTRKNPDKKMRELLLNRPLTSEQVIHYEKFESGEAPTPIDLSALDGSLPADWTLYYANTLGEFDILLLFQTYDATERHAGEFAAGWSGCRWRGYRDAGGNLVIVGLSAWDSKRDAAQFVEGYSTVLAEVYEPGEYEFIESGRNVAFVVGSTGAGSQEVRSALAALLEE